MREPFAQLRVSRHYREIDRRLQVVELELHPPESRTDVGRKLAAKVADAEHATYQHAQKSTHKEDQYQHRHRPRSRRLNASMHYALLV